MQEITFEQLPKFMAQLGYKIDRIEKLLLEKDAGAPGNSDTWFNLDELCGYIPEKPAKPTVYAWVSNQLIPHHKKGKKLYFLKSEIDEWLKSGRKKTVSEIQAEAVAGVGTKRRG